MPDPTPSHADARSPRELMTQWRKLAELKRGLVRDGLCNGNATPAELLACIRGLIPPDLFAETKPPAA